MADYAGLSYEAASQRAQAICAVAAKTGQTISAAAWLQHFARTLVVYKPK